ncbi:hypothetical protein P154DRAFT_559013 [Amniculicola lignicola CBS 123094]|uniref:Uncharacterized protein n=1 Tax=Amniculicola lignicola CBS 123094 TaxID=1392246 RepID=A0A6A5X1R0_9PLEO|nr:hypothetical protein P154DRAFT_559013 [Amniculicola lignicola CBS 123094]
MRAPSSACSKEVQLHCPHHVWPPSPLQSDRDHRRWAFDDYALFPSSFQHKVLIHTSRRKVLRENIVFYDDVYRMRVGWSGRHEITMRCFFDLDSCTIAAKYYWGCTRSGQEPGWSHDYISVYDTPFRGIGKDKQKKVLISAWLRHFETVSEDEQEKKARPNLCFEDETKRILIGDRTWGLLIWFSAEGGQTKLWNGEGLHGVTEVPPDLVDTGRLITELPPSTWEASATLLWRARYGDLGLPVLGDKRGTKRSNKDSTGGASKRIKTEQDA